MIARFNYSSPLGKIGIQADKYGITEVKFVDQPEEDISNPNYPSIKEAVRWLDDYFLGNVPSTYPQFI
jgi:methylated-DNA-[protein]-cysteine S-methyltransferase